ncbi:T9SS type A sorting domain-containing protein [uncultured Polaribacter sp.]|uniref:T9SS type A sorting domain-containing protein n=1 Tax=uncultured Polaribacter sp. TaxID=174711 RepID=UPI002623811E|nr:T9SS type A sorting domain-containing protein [uncultured Polaribacter sp.]
MKNFRKLKLLFTSLLICGISSLLHAQSQNQQELSDIFSKFAAYDSQYTQPAKLSSSGFSFTKAYSTSYGTEANRPWNNTNLESDLFMARLSYTDANPNLSYQASVSTGGGLYSYRNSNGECIPKQRGAPTNIQIDGTYYNQWTEAVWHMVGNNVEHQGNAQAPIKDKIIYHQGGAYGNIAETGYKPFYGFQLADYYNSALEEYSTVAWLQIGHPKATRDSKFYTEILIWTKYRNVGNGILQVDQALYNFGDHTTSGYYADTFDEAFRTPVLDRINAPYTCNNDNTHNRIYMSSSNGTYAEKSGQGWGTTINNTTTDGWVAFTAGDNQINPGAGYGFIFDNGAGINKFGFVNTAKAQNNFTTIRLDTDIYQGDLVNYRYFIALGNDVDAIQSAGSTYKNHTRHELRNMPKTASDDTSYYFEESGNTITAANTTGVSQGLDLKLQPYENSFPIFVVTNSSGVSQVTSDLYSAVRAANPKELYPWNGVTADIKLLGFSDSRATVNEFETITINSGDDYTFPDGTTISNITSDLYKTSFIGTKTVSIPNAEYRQYKQTHVKVTGTLGIEDSIKTDKLLVYPNPVSDSITIDLKGFKAEAAEIEIVDNLGKTIHSDVIRNGRNTIDLRNFSSGLYIVKVSGDYKTYTRRIIKK